jgi:hypothetical protein
VFDFVDLYVRIFHGCLKKGSNYSAYIIVEANVKVVGNIKVIGDQCPRIAASSSLLQNRFQAFIEIVTVLVAIEDIAPPDSASNDMV